jgi:acetoin utilization deacetylase AcuC-like enzyme
MLKVAWSDIYTHKLPEGHRFPMEKYDLLPRQLLYEGTIAESNLFAPEPLDDEWILKTHDYDYWDKLKTLRLTRSEIRKTGFPLSEKLVEREITIANGTLQASLFALQYGAAMNIAGGTHHAFTDRGEGFCLLNDIAIAANYLLQSTPVEKILVVDLDVHQGNGTAEIFANDDRVFTFSMHGRNNYPYRKEASDLDIELDNDTGDVVYLEKLKRSLDFILERFEPDFVFFQSGVDVLHTDKLGKLGMTIDGCKQRDEYVFKLALAMEVQIVRG